MNEMRKEIRTFVNGIKSIDQDTKIINQSKYYPIVYEIRKIVYPTGSAKKSRKEASVNTIKS